jgi:hypothetical protein
MMINPVTLVDRQFQPSAESTMNDTRDLVVELNRLEDDLLLLEQQAKNVIGGLGRASSDLAMRVQTLEQASGLYAEIRRIREKVHALRGTHYKIKIRCANEPLST